MFADVCGKGLVNLVKSGVGRHPDTGCTLRNIGASLQLGDVGEEVVIYNLQREVSAPDFALRAVSQIKSKSPNKITLKPISKYGKKSAKKRSRSGMPVGA